MALDNGFFVGSGVGLRSPHQLALDVVSGLGYGYMARLGDFMFALDTAAFQQLQRTTGYRWQTQKRIGRAPAAQFTGQDDDTIELSGTIYPQFRGGLGQMGRMRAQAGTGEPLPLIYSFEGLGQYVGLWCITKITETRTAFTRSGAPRKIDFQVSLLAYGEDAL